MSFSTLTRRPGYALLLLPLLLSTSAIPAAANYEKTLPLAEAWSPDHPTGRWLAEVVADPAADRSLPPTLTWFWLLSEGERIATAELVDPVERRVGTLTTTPRRLPLVGTEGSRIETLADAVLWNADFRLEITPPQYLHGQHIQAITLHPFRLEDGVFRALERADLRLVTELAPDQIETVKPLRPDFPLRNRLVARFGDALLNPEALPLELPGSFDRALGGAGFPTDVPGLDGASVEMVIVTVDSFADLCDAYAEIKTNTGIPTVVRTLEWIATHYPHGSDRQEMIRNFVVDAYSKWSIDYLLLVGDAGDLPPRYAWTQIFGGGGTTAPTDMYYACLDGDWNADHDANWAEAADSTQGDPGDVTDWLAELNLGRLPAGNRAECSILLDKSLDYHNAIGSDYQNRILMLGEVLFPTTYQPGDSVIIRDGAEFCDSVYINATGPEQEVVRLYENYWDYPGSEILTVSSAVDSMNNGFNIVLHNGHGQRQSMSVGNGSIDNTLAANLSNGDRTFLLYMVNCTAAAFDYNCIAESFLTNAGGGAFGVVGSTRETFADISRSYMDEFFDILYTTSDMTLGQAYMSSLSPFTAQTSQDNGHRWAHSTFTLLADPSNWLHYELLGNLTVDMPASVPLDGTPVTITLTDAGAQPVPDIRVTIRRGDEDYQTLVSDALGQATFDLKAETPGYYSVVADGRDFRSTGRSFQTTAPVSAPLARIATVTVDDLAGGGVVGNGNGIVERGETVRLQISLINNGSAAATGVAAVLTSSSPHLGILDGSDAYADLGIGGSDAGSDPYLVQVLNTLPDDAILPFELAVTTNEGPFTDDFFLEAAAPLLGLDLSELDDSATGNGDGLLDDGETADFSVTLANWGRADAIGVQADVEATAGSSLLVNVGSAALGNLTALTGGQGPAAFNVTRSGADPPELRLILSDAYGRADSLTLLLERPVGIPGAPSYEFLDDATRILANWVPAAEEDAAGYLVFRAEMPEGPYAEITDDWVRNATFEDSGLAPLTPYWYRVQPLSAAGLSGVWSDSSKVTTPLPIRAGWPRTIGQETISTPVVGDFNDDGVNEIFVGSDMVYGFDVDGGELADGDGDVLTHGPISSQGANFRSALAAADLTGSPGLELVASSWDTGEVYLFEFADGPGGIEASIAPGWPRPIGNPGGSGIWASVSLADVDGDRDMEIFVADIGGYLNAWHHDGTEVIDGDNNGSTDGIFATGLGSWPRSTAAFANIDGDLDSEIFVPTANGQLRGYQGDGSALPGFPILGMGEIFSSPAIGDIDDDGAVEIVIAAENDSVYVFNHDGSRLSGWPIALVNNNTSLKAPSPALADITGDGVPEIFVCGVSNSHYMTIGWLDASATWLSGWPVVVVDHSQSSPVVGDLDGDDDFEVVLGHENGQIDAWHHDGTPVDGFPLSTSEFARSVPSLLDIDQNGTLDMIFVGWDLNVYIWEFPTAYAPDMTPWYSFMHGFRRTGNAGTMDWVVSADEGGLLPAGKVLRLDENFPNPFNPKTNIRFTVGGDVAQPVALEIYDVRGRLLHRLVDGRLAPGVYQKSWDGRDSSGQGMSSGIYFARLKVGQESETRKLTLLK